MTTNPVYTDDQAKSLLEMVKVYIDEFKVLITNPDNSIKELPANDLFELFSEAFRVKTLWSDQLDDDGLVVHNMLAVVVDFLCAEIVRRHKEGIL